ncbi:MAG: 16S rRNA (cytosine(1402)-N(4))-methyltransferase RsmH [Rubrimonas sp.]|uniref:16S rRNA (cytosine(1402)-N(4))-methyltransferase RsmH n=1 Tax=Rubrimonas sp. TaxID=2036015 RepID=UPI002FDDD7F0
MTHPPAGPDAAQPHAPVLLDAVLAALAPERGGVHVDGTFGAGGYTRALLDGGAAKVIAIDRDPDAVARGRALAARYGDRLILAEGRFGDLDQIAAAHGAPEAQGVALDIGVSSMQLDQAERGFSFLRDGPLDMRMAQAGRSAADIVNSASEAELADILFQFGEERAARRIARAIVEAREDATIETTGRLAQIVASRLPPQRPGQSHPATRSFQALRIAVNDELGELIAALEAAERLLSEGGVLAVVTFHSLEDRMVKRFLQLRSGRAPHGSRHAPEQTADAPRFELLARRSTEPGPEELARNPRARSARLRAARRTAAPAGPVDRSALGAPALLRASWSGGRPR